jgi:hypothetical protein
LGLVAPLVKPDDFRDTGVDASLLDEVQLPLSSAHAREAQIWQANGLINVLKLHAGDRAYRIASVVAQRAIHENPIGLVSLGLETTLEYFDAHKRQERLWSDLGSGQLPDNGTLELLRTRFSYDATAIARMSSPVYAYFAASCVWIASTLFRTNSLFAHHLVSIPASVPGIRHPVRCGACRRRSLGDWRTPKQKARFKRAFRTR